MRFVLTAAVGAAAVGAAAVAGPGQQQQIPLDAPGRHQIPLDATRPPTDATRPPPAADAGSCLFSRPHGTIYDLIRGCGHTSRFAELVDHHPSLVRLLNSSDASHTLFVPTNDAFGHDADALDSAHVEDLIRYHVGVGRYPARRLLFTHTLPTALHEDFLGGEAQRLRASLGFHGVHINWNNSVVATDIEASNGIIHAVDGVFSPPVMVGRALTLFPAEFSTLLLAYEKTDFVKYIHGVHMVGSTILAPSNQAFKRLGARANAFLFNTEKGRGYLRALLKYHIAPNATLYSDSFYDETGTDRHREAGAERLRRHYDLATLLGDAHVAVDIVGLGGLSVMRVNGFAHVSGRDGIAKNGVIQVLDQVLMPPCHKGGSMDIWDVDVADLKARLDPYM